MNAPGTQGDQVQPDEGGDGAGHPDHNHALGGQDDADDGEDERQRARSSIRCHR
mgnify:CR=1 FL=1